MGEVGLSVTTAWHDTPVDPFINMFNFYVNMEK